MATSSRAAGGREPWQPLPGRLLWWIALTGLISLLILAEVRPLQAAPVQQDALGETCVTCHATPGLQMVLPSGEVRSVTVDPERYRDSVHGTTLQCTACHADVQGYPHLGREFLRSEAREVPFLIRSAATCGACHQEQYLDYLGSTHARELANGNAAASVCADCHGNHTIQPSGAERSGLMLGPAVYACSQCHVQEFAEYAGSVHGKALMQDLDPNVPACVDCHGNHRIDDPAQPGFRRQSPYLCASCHADPALAAQYSMSVHILDTYVADFHGTSVQLFPFNTESKPNQAVCYDCHGVHSILSTLDPNNAAMRNNLLTLCQECHPDAEENFPDAWMGHYPPSAERYAPVYWIRNIYIAILTVGMAAMVGHVGLDMGRAVLNNGRRKEDGQDG